MRTSRVMIDVSTLCSLLEIERAFSAAAKASLYSGIHLAIRLTQVSQVPCNNLIISLKNLLKVPKKTNLPPFLAKMTLKIVL